MLKSILYNYRKIDCTRDSILLQSNKMDHKEPKTRQEKKGKKGDKYKDVYNQKSIRIRESMQQNQQKNNETRTIKKHSSTAPNTT